jgi:peptide/nickel transport system ATP-binding protein/oligopeptide transport system ATP-binding protein
VSTLLEVDGLTKDYAARGGGTTLRAVDDVSLAVAAGETLGVVGESGCGKSTLARLILRLIEPTAGSVRFMGSDLTRLSAAAMRPHRRNMQIVFQDPYASLDPRMTIAAIISEPLDIHRVGDRRARRDRVVELLDLVGLSPGAADRYPHEFSGGQRQRIGIARALALDPKLLVLDEPVSALDVSIQAQILNLLLELRSRLRLSYIFISHDLSVIEHVSDRVAVMYLGRIVESGPADALFRHPLHPYTRALIAAIPGTARERIVLRGDPPSPERLPSGCHFHPRCPLAQELCVRTAPVLRVIEQNRKAECHFATP